jgi:hypothetical protein
MDCVHGLTIVDRDPAWWLAAFESNVHLLGLLATN